MRGGKENWRFSTS